MLQHTVCCARASCTGSSRTAFHPHSHSRLKSHAADFVWLYSGSFPTVKSMWVNSLSGCISEADGGFITFLVMKYLWYVDIFLIKELEIPRQTNVKIHWLVNSYSWWIKIHLELKDSNIYNKGKVLIVLLCWWWKRGAGFVCHCILRSISVYRASRHVLHMVNQAKQML